MEKAKAQSSTKRKLNWAECRRCEKFRPVDELTEEGVCEWCADIRPLTSEPCDVERDRKLEET